MTWLAGTTTLANLATKITQLACGEVADDASVTCASGDQWVREIVGQDLIRTPSSQDVNTGTVHNRAGYFTLLSFYSSSVQPYSVGFHKCFCQCTAAFSGVPTSGVTNNRWMLLVAVQTANTTAGNYSTAQIEYAMQDPDNTGTGVTLTATRNIALNASGQATLTIGTRTVSLQLGDPTRTFTNCTIASASTNLASTDAAFTQTDVGRSITGTNIPAGTFIQTYVDATHVVLSAQTTGTSSGTYTIGGILPQGALFSRAFTSVYLGGIDWFGPFYARRSGNPTFTVNPPGTVTTDYDLNVDISTPYWGTNINSFLPASGSNGSFWGYPGGHFSGVGIKTTAGLTGAQYACSWNMALFKMRLVAAGVNGAWDLEWGGNGQLDGATYRRIGGFRNLNWLKCITTAGSATGSTSVQYWMSVKSNKIIIIVNADPAASGQLGNAGVFPFTPIDYLGGSYDKFPILCSSSPTQSTQTNTCTWQQQWSYLQQKFRQDGSEGRDWQDKWMRADAIAGVPLNIGYNGVLQNVPFYGDGMGWMYLGLPFNSTSIVGGLGANFNTVANPAPKIVIPNVFQGSVPTSGNGQGIQQLPWSSDKPNYATGKWRMYGLTVADRFFNVHFGDNQPSNITSTINVGGGNYQDDQPRGYIAGSVNSPFLYIPGFGWASGDELTDTVSGKKWFLCQHNSTSWCGLLGGAFSTFNYYSTPSCPGVAVLEE